jgi:hypothetical protein
VGKKGLLPRQAKFVQEYVDCLNGAEAYRRAGYKMSGPYANAHYLLSDPKIRAEIDKRINAQTRMQASEILARLERQAQASISMFLKPGTLEIDPEAVHKHGDLIQRLWITAEGPRIMLHDSQKALELLGKSRALFIERQILEQMGDMDIVEDEAPTPPHTRTSRKAAGD